MAVRCGVGVIVGVIVGVVVWLDVVGSAVVPYECWCERVGRPAKLPKQAISRLTIEIIEVKNIPLNSCVRIIEVQLHSQ